MSRKKPNIRTEYSALGRRKSACSLLHELIRVVLEVRKERGLSVPQTAVDLGCGQLRNLRELKPAFPSLYLVDTEFQLSRTHNFGGRLLTIPEYILKNYRDGSVRVMSNHEFAASNVKADVIFSINVMDVVPSRTRKDILRVVREHLPTTGQFASLIPRNDSRTLNLCTSSRVYQDGHLFPNHGAYTYYRNWVGTQLEQLYRRYSLAIVRDMSRYRHSCFICMPVSARKHLRTHSELQRELAHVGRRQLRVKD